MTASAESFAERHRWFDQCVSLVSHIAPAAWATMIVLYITANALDFNGLPRLAITITALTVMVVTAIAEFRHTDQLCVRCGKKTPLNGSRSAELVQWMLWAHHNSLRVILRCCLATVSISLIALFGWLPEIASDISYYAYLAMFAVISQAHLTHRVHRIWCPWCKGWEHGGEPEQVPEPTPPSKTVQQT